jgi:hypothetical protein
LNDEQKQREFPAKNPRILNDEQKQREFPAKNPRILNDEQKQREFPAKKSITKLDHPPCSPDLAPC